MSYANAVASPERADHSTGRAPSSRMRKLGRPREFKYADVPDYLRHWHAPRANRWEHLRVAEAALDMQRLELGSIITRTLRAGETCWIAPGTRWRVAHAERDVRFMIEIHADETSSAALPQAIRDTWLRNDKALVLNDAAELASTLADLAPSDYRLVRARFMLAPPMAAAITASAGTLAWHPLAATGEDQVAILVHPLQPITLADYLGRDHAVIEAALGCALNGRNAGDRRYWLRHALTRHLDIEETLLFPAWLAAGGDPATVAGLLREHADLREHLDRLDEATSRRRFLLMLDAHDEKEERQVYPGLVDKLAERAGDLVNEVLCRG